MRKNRLLLLLALLMTAATGAWAQGPYTVAGNNSAMFGTAWDPTNTANDMTKNGDGTYSITYTNVSLTEEGVKYKVVKNHSWDEAYPNNDRVITIAEAGTYTLTIHFNPTTHEVYETMPGYTVSLADGTEEPTLWSASPATDVKKGQTVTVTYSGTKKVIGVKAEKKKPLIINPVVGQVIGSDGKNYAYGSLPTGVTAVAKICYVSGSNGLALALTDEGEMNWNSAIETCAAHTPAFTSGTWKLPSKDEWEKMISAAGSYTALRNGFSSVGGTNLQGKAYYSSTEGDFNKVWRYLFDLGSGGYVDKDANRYARACLAF